MREWGYFKTIEKSIDFFIGSNKFELSQNAIKSLDKMHLVRFWRHIATFFQNTYLILLFFGRLLDSCKKFSFRMTERK